MYKNSNKSTSTRTKDSRIYSTSSGRGSDREQKAFALIELLVVVAIIGLLSAAILSTLGSTRESARIVAAKQFENSVRASLDRCSEAFYNFEGDSDSVVEEVLGYSGRDGTISGDPVRVEGLSVLGQVMEFNGDDSVSADHTISMSNDTSFTVSAWFYIDDIPSSGNVVGIVGRRDGGRWGIDHYFVGNQLRFGVRGASTRTVSIDFDSGDYQKWHHVVLVHEANEKIQAYLNGNLEGERDANTTWSTDSQVTIASSNAGIGGSPRNFIGKIDNVHIYSCAFK